jgi:hypothetical protein
LKPGLFAQLAVIARVVSHRLERSAVLIADGDADSATATAFGADLIE